MIPLDTSRPHAHTHTHTEALRESGPHESEEKGPHCVPHSAKGEEGSPGACGPAYCSREGVGPRQLLEIHCPLPPQDRLGSLLALKALSGLGPSLSRLFRAPHLSQPTGPAPCWGPDCISLWGAALGSACLATSSGRQDYFLLPPLPLNVSVGVFQRTFNQR